MRVRLPDAHPIRSKTFGGFENYDYYRVPGNHPLIARAAPNYRAFYARYFGWAELLNKFTYTEGERTLRKVVLAK